MNRERPPVRRVASLFGGIPVLSMLAALAAFAGCSRHSDADSAASERTKSALVGYPRGLFWREPEKLSRLIVSFSQIVISHAHVRRTLDTVGVWIPVRRAERSRDEALQIAAALASRLRANPGEFEATALRVSDDEASAPLGGERGPAYALRYPPALLDALANLKQDEVSRVVETEFGLHILRRHAVEPVPKVYSARRITIGYQGVRPEGLAAGRGERTRKEAAALARKLHAELLRDPAKFSEYLRESDSLDGQFAGDWGAWSEREIGVEPLVIAALRRVPIGGLTEVVDTRWGFQILLRDARLERERLAADVVAIGHSEIPSFLLAHRVSRTKEQAGELAAQLTSSLPHQSFQELKRQYCDASICSSGPTVWQQGHMHPQIETIVQSLAVGASSPSAIDTRFGYLLVQRVDPDRVPAPPASPPIEVDFPSAEPWKLEQFIDNLAADRLALFTRQFGRDAVQALDLSEAQRSDLASLIESLATVLEHAEPAERDELFAKTETEAASLLGARRFAELLRYRERWFERMSKL